MREIRFRAKRKDNGEWVHGYLVRAGKHEDGKTHKVFYIAMNRYDWASIFNEDTCDDTFIWRRVDENTVGQYTGLNDDNGVEIYEGDIVCSRFPENCSRAGEICNIGVIKFRDGMFGIEWEWAGKNDFPLRGLGEDYHKEIEVIGNIFDNPELLKEASNE